MKSFLKYLSYAAYLFFGLTMLFELIHAVLNYDHMRIMESCAALVILVLLFFADKLFKVVIPPLMEIVVLFFLYGTIYLGEMNNYYYKIFYWDKIFHIIAGFLLSIIGLSLVNTLNKDKDLAKKLSPAFIVVFTFCFSMASEAIWEIYEFTMDRLINTNMQKPEVISHVYNVVKHTMLYNVYDIGLFDTMGDIIANAIGALAFTAFGYHYIKKGWAKFLDIFIIKSVRS